MFRDFNIKNFIVIIILTLIITIVLLIAALSKLNSRISKLEDYKKVLENKICSECGALKNTECS